MKVTEIREAVSDRLDSFGEVQVWIVPTEYGKSFGEISEIKLGAKIVVGPTSDREVEARIDDLFEAVPDIIADDRTLGGLATDVDVKSCTGHRMYSKPGPDGQQDPMLGAEWTLVVNTED